MSGKHFNDYAAGIPGENGSFLFAESNGAVFRTSLADIIDVILDHITEGENIHLTKNGHSLTISSEASGGGSGQTWYITSTEPESVNEGDLWLHTDTENYGKLYEYSNDEWVYKFNAGKISSYPAGQLTSPNDKLIFESASGSTKYVKVGALSGSQLNITAGDRVLLQSGSTGTIGNILLGAVGANAVQSLTDNDSILIRSGTSSLPVNIPYPVFLQLIRQAAAVNVSALYTVGSGTWSEISGGGGYECKVYCKYESGKRYTIDITPSETPIWKQHGIYVYAYPSESDQNLYLRCETEPGSNINITFRIVSMDAVYARA